MATLKIYEPTIKPKAAADVDLSGVTLPLSIATQEGKAISSVGKAFADIVNHLGETEDENKANELIPTIIKKLLQNMINIQTHRTPLIVQFFLKKLYHLKANGLLT